MNLLMATGAKAPKIALVIRTAICDGLHMMYQGCHGSFAQPKALFAKRMRRDVSVTHLSPSTSIGASLLSVGEYKAKIFSQYNYASNPAFRRPSKSLS